MCVTGAEAAESESACLVPSTGRSGPSIFLIKSGLGQEGFDPKNEGAYVQYRANALQATLLERLQICKELSV